MTVTHYLHGKEVALLIVIIVAHCLHGKAVTLLIVKTVTHYLHGKAVTRVITVNALPACAAQNNNNSTVDNSTTNIATTTGSYLHGLVQLGPQVRIHHPVTPLIAAALVDVVVHPRVIRQVQRFLLLGRRAGEHEVKDVEITFALRRVHQPNFLQKKSPEDYHIEQNKQTTTTTNVTN